MDILEDCGSFDPGSSPGRGVTHSTSKFISDIMIEKWLFLSGQFVILSEEPMEKCSVISMDICHSNFICKFPEFFSLISLTRANHGIHTPITNVYSNIIIFNLYNFLFKLKFSLLVFQKNDVNYRLNNKNLLGIDVLQNGLSDMSKLIDQHI